MLIKCPECQRDVSDSASACPGCGHPIASVNTSRPQAPPSLFGSFLLGGVGGLLRFIGLLAILLSLIGFLLRGPSAFLFLILGIGLFVGGSYARYTSQHTVRLPPGDNAQAGKPDNIGEGQY